MNKKGLMFAFFTAIVSGFSIFVNKFGLTGIDPYVFTGLKNLVVVLFLLSLIFFMGEFRELAKLTKKQWLKLGVIGLFGGSIPFLLFFKGLSMTSAVSGAFIHKTMFIFVTIGAIIFLKEKINKYFVVGAGLLLVGNILLLKISPLSSAILTKGNLFILIATLLWATENLISKHTLKELSSRTVAFGRMAFGFGFILMFWLFTGRMEAAFSTTLPQLTWVLLTSAFLFLYVASWYYALQRLKASVATSILLLGSPITTALSIIFLNTSVTISQGIGMLLIIAGIVMAVGIVHLKNLVKYFIPVPNSQR
ncbi:DMT family transporter [Candidatus Woesearchaeota archaeon]|jgi:drug/metabolite transporter (DMT)-like permease|nr:DMT family transporter [Candidatus Woesearchaeota archaeon]MBT5272791.1 DMT family transporter [Candidatus Woesearchaeota archaeon]MBT6040403.1 DMT family transporter [Candidatus Woesearchaeota archaeon]MBT6336964.1 DMT family transporter [Candidatus Woesearchaeota archaeon]MBT7926850.1 DMT family transporter [Candidatus Woesearchaeota archaeon]